MSIYFTYQFCINSYKWHRWCISSINSIINLNDRRSAHKAIGRITFANIINKGARTLWDRSIIQISTLKSPILCRSHPGTSISRAGCCGWTIGTIHRCRNLNSLRTSWHDNWWCCRCVGRDNGRALCCVAE